MRKRKWHKDPPPVESPEETIALVRLALTDVRDWTGHTLLERLAELRIRLRAHNKNFDYRVTPGRRYLEERIEEVRHRIEVHKYGDPHDFDRKWYKDRGFYYVHVDGIKFHE